MTPAPTPLPPPADALRLRRALLSLAAWQASARPVASESVDEASLQAELDVFAELAQGAHGGAPWTDLQHRGWQRVRQSLLDSAQAQPRVPLLGACTLDCFDVDGDLRASAGSDRPRLGPLTWNLAQLLRDPRHALDEADELDVAIRYWQALRRSALALEEPWDGDFGEFWRACEWTAILQHLGRIGRRLTARGGSDDAPMAPLLAWGLRVAMRYRPLQPLASLLEPWSGARPDAGFTF